MIYDEIIITMNKFILSMLLFGAITSTILDKLKNEKKKDSKKDKDKKGQCKIIPDLEKQEKALLEAKDAKNKEFNALKSETEKEIAEYRKKIEELNKKLDLKLKEAKEFDAKNDKKRDDLKKKIEELKKKCAERKENSKKDGSKKDCSKTGDSKKNHHKKNDSKKDIIKLIGTTRNLKKTAPKDESCSDSDSSSSSESGSGDAWGTNESTNAKTDAKVAAKSQGKGSTMISANRGGIDAFAEGEKGGSTSGSYGANISNLRNSFAVGNHGGKKSSVLDNSSNNLNVDASIETKFKGQGTALAHGGLDGISGGAQGTKGTSSKGGFATNESNIFNNSAILKNKNKK